MNTADAVGGGACGSACGRVWRVAALAAVVMGTFIGSADAVPPGGGDPVTPKTYYEQGILSRSGETVEALGPNLMGDQVNEYSGDLSFTQTDVSLPGNDSLPVQVSRHRSASTTQAYQNGGLFGE